MYASIATELRDRNRSPGLLPPYLLVDGLGKSERRNTAIFRLHCANYVHSHAGYRPSPLFPHSGLMYEKRGCISTHCRYRLGPSGEAPVDSTAHVILECPAHAEAREVLLQKVDEALMRCGLTRESDVGTPQRLVCLLLGSPPANVRARLMVDPTAHRDILRATAHFIRAVYTTRWCAQ